ncbi:MAG: hypothetical protein JWP18_1051 [Solirubrobacterales bacterium]|nr:hypothetical protein [Solirubrobacterales bacterium]
MGAAAARSVRMMHSRIRTAAAVPLLAVVALAGGTPAGHAQAPGSGETPDPAIADGSAQRDLTVARARWKAAHVRSYRVRVALGCFCPESIRRPRTITVLGGSPRRPPSHLKDVATVPRMFRLIQRSIDRGVAGLDVTYGARGVPRTITIDVSRMIADEESYYTIDRFVRLR